MEMKKQQKISYIFGKPQPNQRDHEAEERLRELIEDNKKLKKVLKERESYAFNLQRNLLPQPRPFQAKHQNAINSEISSLGGEGVMRSKLAKQQERLDTYLNLFGIHVKIYTNERCVVIYNIRIKGVTVAQYGIQFTKPADESDWSVCKYHMPVGFRLNILSEYQLMSLEYLRQLQVALVAYHERGAQIVKLKEDVPPHVFVSHNMLGTWVELIFPMIEKDGSGPPVKTALELEYDAFQNRPKGLKIVQNVVTKHSKEFEATLFSQFEIMKYLNLAEAFSSAVSKDGENAFYCPTEVELEATDDGNDKQEFTERTQPRTDPSIARPNLQPIEVASTFKKPPQPKTTKKKSLARTVEQLEDDTDLSVTSALKENKRRLSSSTTSSYQVTDNDLTSGSYVYIPESKKKSSTAKKGKENTKKGKPAKGKSKKK